MKRALRDPVQTSKHETIYKNRQNLRGLEYFFAQEE